MATAISTLTPDVRVYIPEVPSFVVQRHLLRSVREFCEETRAWRVSGTLSTVAGTATISLSSLLPTTTELVDIISMKNSQGGAPLVPRTFKWLDENITNWRSDSNDTANYYVLESNNTIRLTPTPASTVSGAYYTRIAVKPTISATTLDDVLVNKFRETIISGALGLLLMIPRKPWTDAKMAAYHTAKFESAMAAAKTEAAEEFQTGIPRKVKYGGL